MDPKFKTSFIPKTSLTTNVVRKHTRRKGVTGLFTLLALIIFLSVVSVAVGAFLFEQFLQQSIERKTESLERARAAFEPALIQELSRLDSRLKVANNLLENHLAPSALFKLLEENTLETLRFKDFNFTVVEDGRISLSTRGEARGFNSVALQSDIFGKSRFIREPIFTDLNLDQNGNVIFRFTAVIDPQLVMYKRTLSTRTQPEPQTAGTSTPAEN